MNRQIPDTVSTGTNPVVPSQSAIQNKENQQQIQMAKLTIDLPLELVQAFQQTVKDTPFFENNEGLALFNAIELWITSIRSYQDGNMVGIFSPKNEVAFMKMNISSSVEDFQKEIQEFEQKRLINHQNNS